jgi:prolyl-tRNA synthetase
MGNIMGATTRLIGALIMTLHDNGLVTPSETAPWHVVMFLSNKSSAELAAISEKAACNKIHLLEKAGLRSGMTM